MEYTTARKNGVEIGTHLGRLQDVLPAERLKGFPTRHPLRQPSGRLWAHGEFTLGYSPAVSDESVWHEDPCVGMGVEDLHFGDGRVGALGPLNLSDAPKSHAPRRGLKGMTGYGRQMVKAGGFLMEKRYPHHRMTFGTLTVPPLTARGRSNLASGWAEFVRQALQWVRRRLIPAGVPDWVVSVTEIQPRRLQNTGEGYLHLHLLWLNRPAKAGQWAVDPVEFRNWATSAVARISGEQPEGSANVNVKPVKGAPVRYLAKYMSKGGEHLEQALEDWGSDVCPRQWWNLTGSLRSAVIAASPSGPAVGRALEEMMHTAWDTDPSAYFDWIRQIELEFDGVQVTVGWMGRLTPGAESRVRNCLLLSGPPSVY